MNITIQLTQQLADMVSTKVASGYYESPSEVVREALRLMDERDRLRAAKMDGMRDDGRMGASGDGADGMAGKRGRRAPAHAEA